MENYKNLFVLVDIKKEAIKKRINETFNTIFIDPDERFYFELNPSMSYMLDTGNDDARSEGMSYGMMMAVQMNRKDIFDRLWLFSKTFMYQKAGKYEGYFAWSVKPDGTKNAEGPAPDGEEYFALALFFAAARWGDGTEPFDYSVQARDILHHCVHQHELVKNGNPMWEPENYLVKFVPEVHFSDPSYHLPHFYEIFALRANESDRRFWKEAARASREYIAKSCHPITGMASEYAYYDGVSVEFSKKRQQFYSDSYRVAMNIGLDAAWFGDVPKLRACVNRLQTWLSENTELGKYDSYLLDGTPIGEEAMHPVAIIATTAAASLASDNKYRYDWVRDFWNTPLRKGKRRYYDNCLYFFCLLLLSGEYKIY
ncbi:MAG: glycosyl hydrolase family 8 [Lachnospiraceae bacterium]|nr:glycosyl hydrolase family 8 [Lachnospiraceae bacterium]